MHGGLGRCPTPSTSPSFPACGAGTALCSELIVQVPREQSPPGTRVPQYSSHRRLEGRATASGRYPRWAGGLPAGGTWRQHPSVLAGSHAHDCPGSLPGLDSPSLWAQDSYHPFGWGSPVGSPMCGHSSGPQQGSQSFPYPCFMQICGFWRRLLCPSVTQWMKQGEASVTHMSPRRQMEKELAKKIGYK